MTAQLYRLTIRHEDEILGTGPITRKLVPLYQYEEHGKMKLTTSRRRALGPTARQTASRTAR